MAQFAADTAAPLAVKPHEGGHAATDTASAARSYSQILRSSALIGGSSAITMLIGLVRAKAMATLLGPAGFGLMGAFATLCDLSRTIAQLGIGHSGVRQIAEATATGDIQSIARTVVVLRRTALILGVIGAALLAAFSRPLSLLTFGSDQYAGALVLLSLAVFLRLVSDGQSALLQGMRRIGDLARLGVLGALLGTLVSIGLVYWLGEQGVALSLVAVAAMSLLMSWWYSRKVMVEPPRLSQAEFTQEARSLLRLGLAFMVSALLTMGAAYLVRIFLIRVEGLDAAGLYQAAWTVGGLYVGFILQAMGSDFYPRLVAAINDPAECNRLVNEQAQVSLLLAGAGVLATLTFAPMAVTVMYSAEFAGAAETLRWICLGMAIRVITWPLGYILVAKGRPLLFVGVDFAWTVVNVALTWYCVGRFGLMGAGVAFFGSYVFHLLLVYPMCHRLTGFRWSRANLRTTLLFVLAIAAVQSGIYLLAPDAALLAGSAAVLISIGVSFYCLRHLVAPDRLPRRLSWLRRAQGRNS